MLRGVVGVSLMLLLCARGAHAQTILGTVYDAASEDVVANALVSLLDEEGTLQRSAVTGADGTFDLVAPGPGRYHLSVELIGYGATETAAFTLGPDESREFQLNVEHSAIPLDPLVVTVYNENRAGFERRRDLSYGTRIGPDELAEIGERSLKQFTAERTPWLMWARGRLYTYPPRDGDFGRRCTPKVAIDGEMFSTAPGVPAWDLDRWLDREDVRAIEVYTDAYLIPSPFFTLVRERGNQPPCSLIAVWTTDAFGPGAVE